MINGDLTDCGLYEYSRLVSFLSKHVNPICFVCFNKHFSCFNFFIFQFFYFLKINFIIIIIFFFCSSAVAEQWRKCELSDGGSPGHLSNFF